MQGDLFTPSIGHEGHLQSHSNARQVQPIALNDGFMFYITNVFDYKTIGDLITQFAQLNWQQAMISVYGQSVLIPRLQSFYGNDAIKYRYSNTTFTAQPWPPCLSRLRAIAAQVASKYVNQSCMFNAVLGNLYRDGTDSMGWHADDEPELGPEPVIASFSFGAERVFQLKHKHTHERRDIVLENGSLLIMAGKTQQFWYHGIAKSKKLYSERYNFTFRHLKHS